MPKPLFKTTIVIWTEYNPSEVELENLAREATDGDAYCSVMRNQVIPYPSADPDWDGTDFFEHNDD